MENEPMPGWQQGLKRGLDIVLGGIGLLILAIPFAVVAVLIKVESPGPVFFRFPRVGRRGREFTPLKFRTMTEGAMSEGAGLTLSEDDGRVTRVGAFVRAWAIDEMPQIINVLKGEMSLVGPRPTFAYQVEQYDDFQRRRLEVRPGITGLAQISGRNDLSWPERIEMDVWYVDHGSLWLDLKILVKTLWVAFITREGVYAEGGMNPDFPGASPHGEEDSSPEEGVARNADSAGEDSADEGDVPPERGDRP